MEAPPLTGMLLPMGRVAKVLVLLALVVPLTAYVAGALASSGVEPADHRPVILQDAPDEPASTEPTAPAGPTSDRDPGGRSPGTRDDDSDRARVVTPQPTPVGEDDDDEWEDDGPDDDETDERDDDERDD
jgi:hypothetical protein